MNTQIPRHTDAEHFQPLLETPRRNGEKIEISYLAGKVLR